jgi:hypothetical protein
MRIFVRLLVWIVMATAFMATGCQKPMNFPQESLAQPAISAGAFAAYDANHDSRADFFTYADSRGRINRIGYARDGSDKPTEIVDLDAIPATRCRHLVILLDGFCYDVVKQYYDNGGLRMCYPPSRVIAPYPTLTDLGFEDLLGYMPCLANEALYFDRATNRLVGGNSAYLEGRNEPYNRLLQYRANSLDDAFGYLYPWSIYNKEIQNAKVGFDRNESMEFIAYFVSSAGVGTAEGAEGQRRCLRVVDQFVNQVVCESRGLTKVTIATDHGHSYTPGRRIPLEFHLAGKGWHIVDSLTQPKDVVYIRFGIETYAAFYTNQRADLASDLSAAEGVEITSYAEKDAVVVLGNGGSKAIIHRNGDRYRYETMQGDPLKISEILAKLPADAQRYYAETDVFQATCTHVYPDPLARLWRAHFGLVQNPPDVIVSLADNYYSGSASFAGFIKVASTHGGLNLRNSSSFIMSTLGPMPEVMRCSDVPSHMAELLHVPSWPMRK